MKTADLVLAGVVVVVIGALIFALAPILSVWGRATVAGAPVSFTRIARMRFQGLPYRLLVDCYICAKKGDLEVTIEELEAHSKAGGNPDAVTLGSIAANKANLGLSFEELAAKDLAESGSVLEHVRALCETKSKGQTSD